MKKITLLKTLTIALFLLMGVGNAWGQTYLIQEGFATTSLPEGWSGDVYFNSTANHGNLPGNNGAGFNANNKYLQTPVVNAPGTLTFYLKGSSATSQISLKVQKKVGAGEWEDVALFPKPHTTVSIQHTVLINDENDNVSLKFVAYDRSGNSLYLDDIELTLFSASTPTITVTPSTLTDFTYIAGNGPSDSQSLTVEGSNLEGNITVAPPTHYEISVDDDNFQSSSITLTESDGTVDETTVYVRLKAGLSVGEYNEEFVTASSTNADNKTVACSGSVIAPPDPEPTNHATGFSASANSAGQITLIWTDATGDQLPAGYVVKASATSFEDITAPVNGEEETSGIFVKIISYGVGEAVFGELDGSTTYYFKIWPYTNSGVDITYKTDGTIPSASATTLLEPLVIAGWDFDGLSNYGTSPFAATNQNSNVTIGGLMRGSGVGTSGTAAGNAWGGSDWESTNSSETAILNNEFVTFTVQVNEDYLMSLTSISPYNIRRSSTGPSNGLWQYQIGSGSFVDIGSSIEWGDNTTSAGNDQNSIDLSGISDLQNISFGTTVTFRIVNFNSSGTGTWYLNDPTVSEGDDFIINGYVRSTTTIFEGTGNWTTEANWSNGLPLSVSDVIINGNLTVNDVVECNNFTIAATGAVTVGTGQGLFVNGDFLIQSTAAGTGSFIGAAEDYVITGSVTVQRYLTNYESNDDQKYHFISSPVAAQAIRPDWVANTPATDVDLYKFEESSNTWINTKSLDGEDVIWNGDFESNFVVGRGYLVAYPTTPVTNSFAGTLNSGSFTTGTGEFPALTHTAGMGNGWNLIGNPYPSAIDWNLVTRGTGVDDALYYYDASAENYRYYIQLEGESGALGSGSQYIPAMQGFMVHAKSSGTQTITFENDDRTHEGQNTYYKSNRQLVNASLALVINGNNFEDEAFIHFNQNATKAFDGGYDAYKLMSANIQLPMIYTIDDGDNQLSINGLPQIEKGVSVPVSLRITVEGNYTLAATINEIEADVYLEDLITGTSTKLNDSPTYTFTASEGDNPNRFLLHFGAVGIDEHVGHSSIRAYTYNNTLYVQNSLEDAAIRVIDLQGRLLLEQKLNGTGLQSLPLDFPAGVYMVQLLNSKEQKSVKVIVE